MHLVQSMYKDVRSRVGVDDGYSEEFGAGLGIHQVSVTTLHHNKCISDPRSSVFKHV